MNIGSTIFGCLIVLVIFAAGFRGSIEKFMIAKLEQVPQQIHSCTRQHRDLTKEQHNLIMKVAGLEGQVDALEQLMSENRKEIHDVRMGR